MLQGLFPPANQSLYAENPVFNPLKNGTHSTVSLVTDIHWKAEAGGTDLGQTQCALCSSNYINLPFLIFFLILRIRRKLNSKNACASARVKPIHAAQPVPDSSTLDQWERYRAKLPAELLSYWPKGPSVFCFVVLFQAPVTECVQSKRLLLPTFIWICLPCTVSQM